MILLMNNVSLSLLVVALTFAGGCSDVSDVVTIDGSRTGCMSDEDCARSEMCSPYGTCVLLEVSFRDDSKPDASDDSPDNNTLGPAVNDGEPDAGPDEEPDAGEPEVLPDTAAPDAPAPECVVDVDCGTGRICADGTCVVGCDGVPAAGTCSSIQFSYCANPGLSNEEVRSYSLAEPDCFGDILVDSCSIDGKPEGVDCVDLGGDCSNGACITLPAGRRCDDETMLCGNDAGGAQLQCANKDASGEGVCEAGCGDIETPGQCSGTTMTYCVDEGLPTERVESFTCNAGETCAELRPGVFGCAGIIGQGGSCWADDGTISFCGGEGGTLACELNFESGNGSCVTNTDECDVDVTEPTCSGNRLMLGCFQTQPFVFDCEDYGGRCEEGACVSVDRFEPCDGETLKCAFGLQCGFDGYCS